MSYLVGLLVGILLTSGIFWILNRKVLRRLKKECEINNARYQRALDDLESWKGKAS